LFYSAKYILADNMNILRFIVLLIFPLLGISQAPQRINFQSVLRNTNGEVLSNREVSLRISILSGTITGTTVYIETHDKTTDASGLMSLQIGGGTVLSGVFGNINWGSSAHFIKLEADFSGGNSYVLLGTQELMSVPYALYASKTDTSVLNLALRLAAELNISDTASLSARINAKSSLSDTSLLNLISRFATKLSVADTVSLSARINAKSSLSDTSLLNLTSRFSTKLNGADTASLSARIDAKSSLSDTSLLNLTSRFSTKLSGADTVSLSARINAKSSLSDTSLLNLTSRFSTKLSGADTASLSARIDAKSSLSDTSLLNLTSRFSTKLNGTDTTSLSARIDAKLTITDTASLSDRIDAKLSKSDTSTLSNRINAKLSKTDTSSLSDRINAKLNINVFPYYPGPEKGHIMYWNGSSWVLLNPGTAGQVLKMSSGNDPVPVWGTDATTSVPAFSPCGAPISDIDGNVYNTVLIGAQCWTKENLRVRRYNNGTAIPFDATGDAGGTSSTWSNLTIGAHTIYAHDSVATPSNLTKYGYLYNWYAAKGIYKGGQILANDTLRICPTGWHVPTDAEWTTLITELGGESEAGGKMKSIGTVSYWNSPNTEATNSSGFSALPGGYRGLNGSFTSIGDDAFFWSATEAAIDYAWGRLLISSNGNVGRGNDKRSFGASVRCIKD
jgi:uncharacterized protein (TIGR02145 family)